MRRLRFFSRWTILAVIIGLFSGLGAVMFFYSLDFCSALLLGYLGGYQSPAPPGEPHIFTFTKRSIISWRIPLILTIGGLICGIIVYKFAPEAEGHGTDAYISAFHNKKGYIRKRVPLVKGISSAIMIGSGGSAGREGPIAQIGSGFGSWLATKLKLSDKDRRIAIICGAAGGIGSIFKAPLGGAIFALEVLYRRDIETEALLPSFISSITAYAVFGLFFGYNPIFQTPTFEFNMTTLLLYIILGLICAPIAIFFTTFFYFTRDNVFKKIKIPNTYKPAIGGFFVGMMALFIPEILGPGYGIIQLVIFNQITLIILIILIFAKIIATSFTIGSGGSGGVFAPSLFIGAMIGGAFALSIRLILPSLEVEPASFVIVGMAAFITAAAKVPISPIIMVSEMTGTYSLLVPAMLACTVSYIVSKNFSIYESQVKSKEYSPVHRGYFTEDVLETIKVSEVMTKDVICVTPTNTINDVNEIIKDKGHRGFPVIEHGDLVGIITFRDVCKVPSEKTNEITVGQLMTRNIILTYPELTLSSALRDIEYYEHGYLPVVEYENPSKLVGIITKSDIIRGHGIIKRKFFNSRNFKN